MKIEVTQDSIIKLPVEVIVNPANPLLTKGGGLSGLIHKAAGEDLFHWLKAYKFENKIPALRHGEILISPSFDLKCKAIIHAVGPVWKDGKNGEKDLLKNIYKYCIELAEQNQFNSIAFPNISTGIYGFPKKEAAPMVIQTLNEYLPNGLEEIILCCYDDENYQIYQKLIG